MESDAERVWEAKWRQRDAQGGEKAELGLACKMGLYLGAHNSGARISVAARSGHTAPLSGLPWPPLPHDITPTDRHRQDAFTTRFRQAAQRHRRQTCTRLMVLRESLGGCSAAIFDVFCDDLFEAIELGRIETVVSQTC